MTIVFKLFSTLRLTGSHSGCRVLFIATIPTGAQEPNFKVSTPEEIKETRLKQLAEFRVCNDKWATARRKAINSELVNYLVQY